MSETLTIAPAEAIEMSEFPQDKNKAVAVAVNVPVEKKERSTFQIATIVLALNLALLVSALNDTVLANAVPTIANEFNSATGYVWIAGAHSLAKSSTTPLWAKFSDIWGRKPILLAALSLFFCASLICALSVNIEMLIAGRVLQGIGGGGIFGMIMIVVSDIFSVRTRTLFFGIMSFTWAVAGAAGPIMGGAFTQQLTWRWCFYINLPTSGVAFLLLVAYLDVHNPKTTIMEGLKAIDWFGSLSLLAVLLMILLGLDLGGAIFPWSSPKVICLIVFGALCSVFLYMSEKRAKHPVIPLRIFKSKANVFCIMVSFFQSFVFIGAEYYLPLYFQSVAEASPLRSGILTVPLTVTEAFSAILAGILIHRTGRYKEFMVLGTFLMTLGNGLYINLGAASSVAAVAVPQVVAGLGVGALFDPPLIALHANIAQKDVATASAALGTLSGLGSAISIVVGGAVFQNGMLSQKDRLLQAGLSQDLVERIAGPSAAANIDQIPMISDPSQKLVAKEAISYSMRNMWIMYTCFAFLGLLSSLLVKKHVLSDEHTETKTGLKKDE